MADGPATAPLIETSVESAANNENEEHRESSGGFVSVEYEDIVRYFTLMGWTAFGGPQAHIGMFETTFVQKLKWMSETAFMELYSLAACLPGPTSTQVSFALGAVKTGIPGGLLGGALFQLPGLVIMSLVGVGAASFLKDSHVWEKATTDGLGAVGVALVAVAAKGLVGKAIKGPLTSTILLMSACISYVFSAAWLFPALIVGGGLVTLLFNTFVTHASMALAPLTAADGVVTYGMSRKAGAALLGVWASLLVLVIWVRSVTSYDDVWIQPLHWFESFYRIGSLIYGGGQVVLPMLIQETVQQTCKVVNGVQACTDDPNTWVTQQQFKAGLAIIQAMPGPMFNLSAYLGATIAVRAGWNFMIGVAACWLGLFGPGIMLLYGLLPFWGQFRQSEVYRRSLPGFNAAAVGLVVMAVFSMYNTFTATSVIPRSMVAIGMIGFALVDTIRWPAPLVVVLGGALGFLGGVLGAP